MRVLVTGGAGYVGSVTVERLLAEGHEAVVLDSFLKGKRAAVPPKMPASSRATSATGPSSSGRCATRPSTRFCIAPGDRWWASRRWIPPDISHVNVVGGLALLDAMRATGVGRIVFSSSAAVYGAAHTPLIEEDQPLRPVNAYGETKRAFEGALDWYARAYDMAAVSLRYFNAAGASEERGEDHRPETHLIPNMLKAAMGGEHAQDLRHRLRHSRRDVHPRLHPRSRSGRCPHQCPGDDCRGERHAHCLQPGVGQWLQRAGGPVGGPVDHRSRSASRLWAAARGRPRSPGSK